MMKFWGERLVAGLKNWRSRKGDVVPNRKSEAGPDERSDQKTEKSIKNIPSGGAEKVSKVGEIAPANATAHEQRNDDSDGIPEHVTVRQGGNDSPRINKPSTSKPGLKVNPKNSRQPLTAGKEPTAKEADSADKPTDRRSSKTNPIKTTERKLPQQIMAEARSNRSAGSDEKAAIQTESKSPSRRLVTFPETSAFQEPSNNRQTSQTNDLANKNVAAPVNPSSPRKRTGSRTPEITDESVTDKQLAELEAENSRLKLLLREMQSTKED